MGKTSSIDVKLNLATKEAVGEAAKVKSVLGDVETAEGQVESAGKQMARALSQAASDIQDDLKQSSVAADALGEALGPELAAKLGRSGVEGIVAKLKGLGLTSDDIVTDVDELAGAIQHLDQVGANLDGPKKGLTDVGDSAEHAKGQLGEMREEGDNSRSVLANMVGNSTQDLASLGGVAGTAGMALGQLGEYATEGEISLQGLAKVAGPMAAVTVVALGISSALGKIAKEKAFDTHRVDLFTKALQEGKTAAEAWDAALDGKQKVEFIDAATGDVADLTHTLAENNITWAEFKGHLDDGKTAFDAWALSLTTTSKHADDANHLYQAGNQLLDEQATALQNTTEFAEVYGLTTDQLKAKQEELDAAAQNAADTIGKGMVKANDDAAAALERHRKNSQALEDGVTDNLEAIMDEWGKLTGDINNDETWINLQSSFDDLKVKVADAWKAAGDGADDATTKTRDAHLAIDEQKKAVIDYGKEVLGLPPTRVTEMLALIDQGSFDLVEQQLAILTRNRNISIEIQAKGGAGYGQGQSSFATGGTTPGGKVRVGEAGPEDVYLPAGSQVIPNDRSRAGFQNHGDIYITQVLPAGTRMDDLVAQAQRRRSRRNGY